MVADIQQNLVQSKKEGQVNQVQIKKLINLLRLQNFYITTWGLVKL
jgi:hypothetical protein